MRSSHKNIVRVPCDTCFMGHLERRFDNDTHFHIWPKVRSSLGPKRSNFETQKFIFKSYLSCPVLPQASKNVIFWRTIISNSKKCGLKKDVITFTRFFFGHCTARNKDISLKFLHWLLVYNYILYIPFIITSKIFIL